MASNESSPDPEKISLTLGSGALDSGITELWVENNLSVAVAIKLPELDVLTVRVNIDHKNFPQMVQKLMRSTRNMLAAKISDKTVINAIVYQIATTLNEDQNYALFRKLADEELEKKANGRISDAKVLVDLALSHENAELFFKNQYGEPYAAIRVGADKHLEIVSLESNKYQGYLMKLFYEKYGKLIGKDSLSRAINLLAANTVSDDRTISLHVRVAWGKPENRARLGCIYVDMTDSQGRMIEVSPDGWRVIHGNEPNIPIIFRRYNQNPQVEPDKNYEADIFDRFLSITNVRNKTHQQLLKVYIVTLLVPDIDHAILTTYGPKGAAKTFLLELIKKLIDPSKPLLLTLLRDVTEFIRQVNQNHCCFFDNVKYIPYWLSDEICKAVTRIGNITRKLYTDDENIVREYQSCIAINGIDVALTEPDALDRSLFTKLEDIEDDERKKEEDLDKEFETIRPKLLAYILDILVRAMRIKPSLRLKSFLRMADFTEWGEAISRALGYEEMSFIEAYKENRNEQNIIAIDQNIVGRLVVNFYKDLEERNSYGFKFLGSPEELHKELVAYAERNEISISGLPRTANVLVKKINAIRPNLKETYDLIIDISRTTDNYSVITIFRRKTSRYLEELSKINAIKNYYEQIVQRQHVQNYENFMSCTPNIAKVTSGTSEHPPDFPNLTKESGGTEVPEVNSDICGTDIMKSSGTHELRAQPDKTETRDSNEQ